MGQTCSCAHLAVDGRNSPVITLEHQQQQEACELYYPAGTTNRKQNTTTASSKTTRKKSKPIFPGQGHLLYKRHRAVPVEIFRHDFKKPTLATASTTTTELTQTKLVTRTLAPLPTDEPTPGLSGTHIYAVRESVHSANNDINGGHDTMPSHSNQECAQQGSTHKSPQEQRPSTLNSISTTTTSHPKHATATTPPTTFPATVQSCPSELANMEPSELFRRKTMNTTPCDTITDWVCVSPEFKVYICDTGLSFQDCNALVACTEHACHGQYAAYTYAKQTLGCRDHPILARTCFTPVLKVTRAIQERLLSKQDWIMATAACSSDGGEDVVVVAEEQEVLLENTTTTTSGGQENQGTITSSATTTTSIAKRRPKLLQLDDREPHIVKYDLSRKERQKLDMHTDKSEWTFLIALSDFCDYEEGGTFFEALDATVHIQRGHALIFPGKLRHCGIRIKKGLRFLLVGFLVDKNAPNKSGVHNNTKAVTGHSQQVASKLTPSDHPGEDNENLVGASGHCEDDDTGSA